MLKIKTVLKASPIHGIGVFADEFIPMGKEIWEFNNKLDVIISPHTITNLPDVARNEVLLHAFSYYGLYYLGFDNDKFTNHSDDPNTALNYGNFRTYALRDINIGEELTIDYYSFDGDASIKLK